MNSSKNKKKPKKINWKKNILISGIILSALSTLFFGLLALFVTPAPNARNSQEITGTVQYISEINPESGDIGIVLEKNQSFYINGADEIPYLDAAQMLADIHVGDEVILTVVLPIIWRIIPGNSAVQLPIAGIRTQETIYMDATISSHAWTAQAGFSRIALISLGLFIVLSAVKIFITRNQPKAVHVETV